MSISSRIEQIEQHLKADYDVLGLGGAIGTELPIGYTQVDYIESSISVHNANYIDLNFMPNNNTSLEIEFEYYKAEYDYTRLYGSSNLFRTETETGTDNKVTYFYWNGSRIYNTNISQNVKTKVKQDKNKLYINEQLVATATNATWQDVESLRLFSATTGNRDGFSRIYGAKLWDNGTLIRNMIPCYRNSDNEIGMYDLVNDVFYINGGNTPFLYGNVILHRNIENLKGQWEDRLAYYLGNGLDVVWNNWEKVNGTGETLSLTPTIKGKMKVDLKGNTYQYSTSGKNFLNMSNDGGGSSGVTVVVNNQIIKVSGTNTNPSTHAVYYKNTNLPTFQIGETYTFSTDISSHPGLYIQINYKDSNNTQHSLVSLWESYATFTVPNDFNGVATLFIALSANQTTVNSTFKLQVEKGTSKTEWEEYTGGQPSPNPDYPQDIQVVSGDNTIKVEGKNLWDFANNNFTSQNAFDSVRNSDGSITFTCSNNGYCFAKHTITLDAGTYTLSTSSNSNFTVLIGGTEYSKTFTINETKNVDIRCFKANATTGDTLTITWIQLEKGSTASSYQPYQSTTYPISLGNIELCKIGTYQDSIVKDNGKWYLNKQIGKATVSSFASKSGTTRNNDYYTSKISGILKPSAGNVLIPTYSNYFTQNTGDNIYSQDIIALGVNTNGTLAVGFGLSSSITTLELANQWITNNNILLYFPLATPTNTEITDSSLKEQLNNLENAMSYDSQTNISQTNDDMPFELDITALKEMS